MARKRITSPENMDKAFPKALRSLMEDRNVTQQELADYIGKTRQSISYYCDGSSSPDWETLAQISRYFDVSVDWLLGLSSIKTTKADIRAVCDYTGLSEEAVANLHAESKDKEYISAFSNLLSSCYDDFHSLNRLLYTAISYYRSNGNKRFSKPFCSYIPENMQEEIIKYLDEWGGIMIDPPFVGNYYANLAAQKFERMIEYAAKYADNEIIEIHLDDI